MKSSASLLLLATVKLGLCVTNGIPSGPSIIVRFTTQDNEVYYLDYTTNGFQFNPGPDLTSAANIVLDTASHWLFAPSISQFSPTGFELLIFSTQENGVTPSVQADGIGSGAASNGQVGGGVNPLYCTLGASFDGLTAPLTCSLPGTPYDSFILCEDRTYIYAYQSAIYPDPELICRDAGGVVTAFTALGVFPVVLPPASSSSSSVPTSTSTANIPTSTSSAAVPSPTTSMTCLSSGISFSLQFTTQSNGVYYLDYSTDSGFSVGTDYTSAATVILQSSTNYLLTPSISQGSPSGFEIVIFPTFGSGGPAPTQATVSGTDSGATLPPGFYPIHCTLGAVSSDGLTAPLTCSVPGSGFDQFAICSGNVLLYAYTSSVSNPQLVCGDPNGEVTAINAVNLCLPASSTSSTSASTSTSPAGVPASTSPFPTNAVTTFPSSTVAGSCPVTFELDIVTTTVTVPAGFSTPGTSTDPAVISTLNSLSSRYGCADLQTVTL